MLLSDRCRFLYLHLKIMFSHWQPLSIYLYAKIMVLLTIAFYLFTLEKNVFHWLLLLLYLFLKTMLLPDICFFCIYTWKLWFSLKTAFNLIIHKKISFWLPVAFRFYLNLKLCISQTIISISNVCFIRSYLISRFLISNCFSFIYTSN